MRRAPSRPGWRLALVALLVAGCSALPAQEAAKPLFYHPVDYGSESEWNPLSSFITWSYDTLQVPQSFNDFNLDDHWLTVRHDLTHVNSAVRNRGGWGDFINRQVIPYRMTEYDWVPNYSLHVIGGGMVYRKNAEWLEAHDCPAPWLTAAALCMGAEVLQECVEKTSTKSDDEIADVYLFRPLGMLLYRWDAFARFAADDLRLCEWNYQPMFDPDQKRPSGTKGVLTNVGQNFVARPAVFGSENHRAFVYFGLTNLFGLSHRVGAADSFSWGVGAAMEHAQDPTKSHLSGGLFWDRNDSLLASLIVNGTDDLKVRLNVYPGIVGPRSWWAPGFYASLGRNGEHSFGLCLRLLPVGFVHTSAPTGYKMYR